MTSDPAPFNAARWEPLFLAFLQETDNADAAHDLAHIRRVVANARSLLATEAADPRIVLPAAWLHDCVSVPKSSPDRKRASQLAAEAAVARLQEWNYPKECHSGIHHAIAAHSFSAGIEATTLEAQVVQDADRLDALGAMGLARCLMLGGQMGRPLYADEDPFCDQRSPDDRIYTIDHFPAKLLTLAATMHTAAGRAEADRRTAYLQNFLTELRRELGQAS